MAYVGNPAPLPLEDLYRLTQQYLNVAVLHGFELMPVNNSGHLFQIDHFRYGINQEIRVNYGIGNSTIVSRIQWDCRKMVHDWALAEKQFLIRSEICRFDHLIYDIHDMMWHVARLQILRKKKIRPKHLSLLCPRCPFPLERPDNAYDARIKRAFDAAIELEPGSREIFVPSSTMLNRIVSIVKNCSKQRTVDGRLLQHVVEMKYGRCRSAGQKTAKSISFIWKKWIEENGPL